MLEMSQQNLINSHFDVLRIIKRESSPTNDRLCYALPSHKVGPIPFNRVAEQILWRVLETNFRCALVEAREIPQSSSPSPFRRSFGPCHCLDSYSAPINEYGMGSEVASSA
jgi:hypothetical protein